MAEYDITRNDREFMDRYMNRQLDDSVERIRRCFVDIKVGGVCEDSFAWAPRIDADIKESLHLQQ